MKLITLRVLRAERGEEGVVTYFNVLSQHQPGATEEITKNLRQSNQYPGRDLNAKSFKYEARISTERVSTPLELDRHLFDFKVINKYWVQGFCQPIVL
jgi:hypothetical protein